MFNVGVISSGISLQLLSISDRQLPTYEWPDGRLDCELRINSNGLLDYRSPSGAYTIAPGEWYRDAPIVGIGLLYEYKTDWLNGNEPNSGATYGNWVQIDGQKIIRWRNSTGSLRLSIRRIGDTVSSVTAIIKTP